MTGAEIRTRIEELNGLLVKEATSGTFIYNPKIEVWTEEIRQLKEDCEHSYNESGNCIYCGRAKGECME